jgi:hypothetical protein
MAEISPYLFLRHSSGHAFSKREIAEVVEECISMFNIFPL